MDGRQELLISNWGWNATAAREEGLWQESSHERGRDREKPEGLAAEGRRSLNDSKWAERG